jgi:hypothetical protein
VHTDARDHFENLFVIVGAVERSPALKFRECVFACQLDRASRFLTILLRLRLVICFIVFIGVRIHVRDECLADDIVFDGSVANTFRCCGDDLLCLGAEILPDLANCLLSWSVHTVIYIKPESVQEYWPLFEIGCEFVL